MVVLLVICGGLLAYAFFLYPAILFGLARRRPVPDPGNFEPRVSVLIPVFNEEAVLPEKLENCLALDYPPDKLEIVFASDGSTDRSVEILRARNPGRATVIAYPVNRGKTAVLNETIPQLNGEIVVLTDASGLLNPEAVRRLAAHFADARIGCVCGVYHIIKEGRSHLDTSESSYHGFEMKLRLWEGRIRTTLSGTGSLCAFRRAEFRPLPADLINEDYVLPARLALGGQRVIYETGAHIHDKLSTGFRQAFRRRVRIAYGNWQQIGYLKPLLNPFRGFVSWVFYSHKLLRMALPYLLVAVLAAAFFTAPVLAWAGTALLGAALVAGLASLWLDQLFSGRNPLGFIVVVLINCLAVFWGTCQYFARRKVRW